MDNIRVEVVHAKPDRQLLVEVQVPKGTTVRDAIEASGILESFPEIDVESAAVGIFSERVTLETPVSAGDRVEIYRPLEMDPKEARRQRAERGAS